jgi:hypothetical protein
MIFGGGDSSAQPRKRGEIQQTAMTRLMQHSWLTCPCPGCRAARELSSSIISQQQQQQGSHAPTVRSCPASTTRLVCLPLAKEDRTAFLDRNTAAEEDHLQHQLGF